MLTGIWGVMMWPMLYAGWLHFYPSEAHTRIMIEGFLGAFVHGFIGTAVIGLAAGLVCAAVWPMARIGSRHLFFVTGLGLVTMAHGTR